MPDNSDSCNRINWQKLYEMVNEVFLWTLFAFILAIYFFISCAIFYYLYAIFN